MYYPEELIEDIRIQNDIVDVISQYTRLNKKGNSYFGLCPFHNEKTPSFSVSRDKQMYHCFGCSVGGNVITFIMEYENYTFIEAVKYLANRVNISLPEPEISEELKKVMNYKQLLVDINRESARYFYYQLKSNRGKKALTYLIQRGIKEDTIKKFGLGYSNYFRDDLYNYLIDKKFKINELMDSGLIIEEKQNKGKYYDRFFNRIMFPIFDVHNKVIGFGGRIMGDGNPKYLNSPETKLFDKSRNLYGLNFARTSRKDNIIIVEGYMDVISLHQDGFTNVVASLGTSLTSGQASLIKKYTQEVILAYDSDNAGINATLRAIPILKATGLTVRVLKILEYKDPDEYIKNLGREAFERLLNTAMTSFMFEVEQLEDKYNLDDPEHRTKFDKEIAQKLLIMDSEIERNNYLEAIVKKYNIKKSSMELLIAEFGKNSGIILQRQDIVKNDAKDKNGKSEDSILLAQKNIITFIVTHKHIFKEINKYLSPEEFSDEVYKKVANIIYGYYNENSIINPALIINKFTELDEQNKVASIFNNNVNVNNQIQFEKMINENVRIVKNAYIDNMSRKITEASQLQELIKAKRELQTLYISLNDG
jgi:DNA primase